MKVALRGVNLTVTPSLRRYVLDKIARPAERLLATHTAFSATVLEIELVHGTRHHKKGMVWEAAANLQAPGKHAWHRAFGEDIHKAIDELESVLKREIQKYKERSRSRLLRGARQAKKDIRFARSARLYRHGRIREEGV